MDQPSGNTIAAVDRAVDVLDLFATTGAESLGVTEIAESLGMSKAVVHRILTTLRNRGLIKVDSNSRRYSLGPGTLTLGFAYLNTINVRALARERLAALSSSTRETATLSLRSGWSRLYIDQVTPNREVKMTVELGRPYPLHAGASSKAFLAFLSEEERSDYLSSESLQALTDRTLTDVAQLKEQILEIRGRGYAVSDGERQVGAASVAAPVFNHEVVPVAVMSVCGPADRFAAELPDAASRLLEATGSISRDLGWTEA